MSISRGSGVGRDLLGHRDQLVGGLAARARAPRRRGGPARGRATIRRGGALDALGVGDGGAAELHDDGARASAGDSEGLLAAELPRSRRGLRRRLAQRRAGLTAGHRRQGGPGRPASARADRDAAHGARPTPAATPTPAPPGPPAAGLRRVEARAPGCPLVPAPPAQVLLVGFDGRGPASSPVFERAGRATAGAASRSSPDNAADGRPATASSPARRVAAARRAPAGSTPLVLAQLDGGPRTGCGSRPEGRRSRARAAASATARAGRRDHLRAAAASSTSASGARPELDRPRRRPRRRRRWLAGGVMAAPAHFPGQGAATQDPLRRAGRRRPLAATSSLARDLAPFRAALESAPAVVVSSAAVRRLRRGHPRRPDPGDHRASCCAARCASAASAITDDLPAPSAATGLSPRRGGRRGAQRRHATWSTSAPTRGCAAPRRVLGAVAPRRPARARLREAVARVLAVKRRAACDRGLRRSSARDRQPSHPASERAAAGERPAERDLVGVLEVAADGQAGGQARDRDVGRAARRSASAMCSAVASPVVVGLVASTTSRTLAGVDAPRRARRS